MYLRMIILVVVEGVVGGGGGDSSEGTHAMRDESELLCYYSVESQSSNSNLLLLTCEM